MCRSSVLSRYSNSVHLYELRALFPLTIKWESSWCCVMGMSQGWNEILDAKDFRTGLAIQGLFKWQMIYIYRGFKGFIFNIIISTIFSFIFFNKLNYFDVIFACIEYITQSLHFLAYRKLHYTPHTHPPPHTWFSKQRLTLFLWPQFKKLVQVWGNP